jgi:putative transposase
LGRKKRKSISGASYHVMLRGNDGQDIYVDDLDRCKMCMLIQQGIERYGHRIHAFCFMSNHIHLLLQIGDIPLSTVMHNLAFRYSQFFNKRHDRIGHLFQGRFKSVLIDEDAYFKRLLRYIHMNPVRADLVAEPEAYHWSGHNTYLELDEITWCTTLRGLKKFSDSRSQAQSLYSAYVKKEESSESLEKLRRGFSESDGLGSDTFRELLRKEKCQGKLPPLSFETILTTVATEFGICKNQILSKGQSRQNSSARAFVAHFVKQFGFNTIEDVSAYMSREASSISSLISRLQNKKMFCQETTEALGKIECKLIEVADLQAWHP